MYLSKGIESKFCVLKPLESSPVTSLMSSLVYLFATLGIKEC